MCYIGYLLLLTESHHFPYMNRPEDLVLFVELFFSFLECSSLIKAVIGQTWNNYEN